MDTPSQKDVRDTGPTARPHDDDERDRGNQVPEPTNNASNLMPWFAPKAWLSALQEWWSPAPETQLKQLQARGIKMLRAKANSAFDSAQKIMMTDYLNALGQTFNQEITQEVVDTFEARLEGIKQTVQAVQTTPVFAPIQGASANLGSAYAPVGTIGATPSMLSLGQ